MKHLKKIIIILLILIIPLFLLWNPLRTIWSFKKIPNTDMYYMDYYSSYSIEKVYDHGVDVKNPALGLLKVYFPSFIASFINKRIASDTFQNESSGCSSIAYQDKCGSRMLARNFEFEDDPILILHIQNNKHHHSIALLDLTYLNLTREKLKDLSFTDRCRLLFAPYIVEDGMNEKGVAIAEMCTGDTMMQERSTKPAIFESLLFRVILDYAGTVDEAIHIVKRFNVHFLYCNEHFMLADSSGNSAVIEFTNGKMEVVKSQKKWQVSTNHILYNHDDKQNMVLCPRYKTAMHYLDSLSGIADKQQTTCMMKLISEPSTIWTSIYDLKERKFSIYSKRNYDKAFDGTVKVNNSK